VTPTEWVKWFSALFIGAVAIIAGLRYLGGAFMAGKIKPLCKEKFFNIGKNIGEIKGDMKELKRSVEDKLKDSDEHNCKVMNELGIIKGLISKNGKRTE
jgi:hypothetical protein